MNGILKRIVDWFRGKPPEEPVLLLTGHVLDRLRDLPEFSVQTCVTSPPYWGLRDYSRCGCVKELGSASDPTSGLAGGGNRDPKRPRADPDPSCPRCHGTGRDDSLNQDWGDWHGQLGLEPTPDLYVRHIVQVFRDVKRVLRDDGTLWCNMGDSYANSPGLKPKDLMGMPWRVAFALQADGWYLRSDIVWAKPNPMPESVTDRPTKAHEYVFLMSKSARYFYDADAVREGISQSSIERWNGDLRPHSPAHGSSEQSVRGEQSLGTPSSGRNLRSVWTIPTHPYKDAHFATFPEALVEPCIKAGTSERGCCATCGAAWERVREKTGEQVMQWAPRTASAESYGVNGPNRLYQQKEMTVGTYKTLGFRPTCAHPGEPVPCVVLDPFGGSGTVGSVARRLGRKAVLIEVKEEYAAMILKRIKTDGERRVDEVRARVNVLEAF